MQWVVTTGRTVAEATERALDVLGVDESELEVEVLDEPGSALFGLRTVEARVRARVRPTRPRPKVERRTRRPKPTGARKRRSRRSGRGSGDTGADIDASVDEIDVEETEAPAARRPSRRRRSSPDHDAAASEAEQTTATPAAATAPDPQRSPSAQAPDTGTEGSTHMSDIALDEQEPTAVEFVTGLVEAFGATGTVTAERIDDDDALEIHVDGEDLGLLVGQRGTTLAAIAELTRTAVAQQHSGRLEGRLRVDIAGYRAKRKEALIRFAAQVADKAIETGKAVAMEPMSPPDRKIVHDAINDLDGVHTSSRGEDRHRHVVVHPD